MRKLLIMFTVGLLFLLVACSGNIREADGENEINETVVGSDSPAPTWQTISATEAYNIMAESDNYILLDVRTEEEYREIRIEGAILIPHDEIRARAESELTDKNATLLVYCRSGRRSALAAADLVALGFGNVYDFGGINDWPYETVSE